jgi:hypothetical protein
MTPLRFKPLENIGQFFYCHGSALTFVGYFVVLTEHTGQRTARKEHRAGAVFARQARLLVVMRRGSCDAQYVGAAETAFIFAVGAAFFGTQSAI